MIAYLQGTVLSVGIDTCVVFVSGIGYRVYYMGCSPSVGDHITWHVYDHIREDRRELFASSDCLTLDVFEKLIDINGVGPRLAQKILSTSTSTTVQERILQEDVAFLTSIPGVGKKTAQKIILELKGVLVKEQNTPKGDEDVVDALMSLGYGRREAYELAQEVQGDTMEEKIRSALKSASHGS